MAESKKLYIGSPISTVIVATTAGFSFNDYENTIVYLYSNNAKTVKLSVLPKTGYLPITIVNDTQLKIDVQGNITKKMGRGEIRFEVFHDDSNPMENLLGGTLFGIELVDNQIKQEVI